jgi:23S rRNA (cytosine1962-C5)-methyltransferase
MEAQLRAGYPWAGMRELVESSEQALADPGELAELRTMRDEFVGIGTFTAGAAIAFRLLTAKREPINAAFFKHRLAQALKKRQALYSTPYWRLVHAEADGLPGLTIDQCGSSLILQVSTAGIERFLPDILQALEELISPETIILRNDIPAREREGLVREVRVLKGTVPDLIEIEENGCIYYADLLHGQKTGWFFDQRDNRAMVAREAKGKTLLDAYAHSGGFGILAAKQGASHVTCLDSSALALALAAKASRRNNVQETVDFLQADALEAMETFAREGKTYDIVVADPPAFIKSHAHIASGMKGYAKVAAHAAACVAPGGMLVVASCSHHATRARLKQAVLEGMKKAGRSGTMVQATGAAADHPVHPHLPQSEYLNALFLRLS